MAAIGKIRSWGPWLVGIIGLALFGFIATDFTRSCETSSNIARQQMGKVEGKKVSNQDFQQLVAQYENDNKMVMDAFKNYYQVPIPDVDKEMFREMVWQTMVRNTIIASEAEKLGLGVTDQELAQVLEEGTNSALQNPLMMMQYGRSPLFPDVQVPIMPIFFNPQTGMFDHNIVKQYYESLKQSPEALAEFDRYWTSVEQRLRQSILAEKYATLLASCMLSNEASAQMAFDGANTTSNIDMAYVLFSSISDEGINVTDDELKAKYEEKKSMFVHPRETRDVKYVAYQTLPSDEDIKRITDDLTEAAASLAEGKMNASDIQGKHKSTISYRGKELPYNAEGLRSLSPALFNVIDTLKDGETMTTPVRGQFTFYVQQDGRLRPDQRETMAVARLNRKYTAVDSIQYKGFAVPGATFEEMGTRADSLIAEMKKGISIDSIAKSLGVQAEEQWFSANEYQMLETVNANITETQKRLHGMKLNDPQKIEIPGRAVNIITVTDRREATLYDVVIVSSDVRFFTDTEEQAFNKFSSFVSSCKNATDFENNAPKAGYQVLTQNDLESNAIGIGAVHDSKAVKWVFATAKEGEVSEVYRNPNGLFLAVALNKVNPVGYRDQKNVEEYLRQEVIKDKKAQKILSQLAGVTTPEQAVEKANAERTTVNQVTFGTTANPSGVGKVRGLSGAVAGVEKGQTVKKPFRADNGVFFFTVTDRTKNEGQTFERRAQENQLANQQMNVIFRSLANVLVEKAKVEDRRVEF